LWISFTAPLKERIPSTTAFAQFREFFGAKQYEKAKQE
jgi:hypothetical protein